GVAIAIYRLTFHPLAKYPGPFLAKISGIDNIWWAWKGKRYTNFLKCHEKYGPIYRYGPNLLSFNTSTALADIYGPKANVQKAKFYNAFVQGPPNVFNGIEKKAHATKRRLISPAFSERALRSFEDSFLENIQKWCSLLKEKGAKETLNMADMSIYLSFDVMGALAFGKSFNMIGGENRRIVGLIESSTLASNCSGSMVSLHNTWFSNLLLRRGNHGQRKEELAQYTMEQAAERSKAGVLSDRKDFFHYLLDAKDSETGEILTLPSLTQEGITFIIAGSDTASTTLAGTFFYLARNPDVRAIVREEVRNEFESVEDIRVGPKLNNCVYLRACIEETLRITPPVPGAIPREVLRGGTMIDGHHIPAGVDVSVAHFAIMHNPQYYSEPFRYKPERWIMKDDTNERKKRGVSRAEVEKAQSAFCAFSIGPRSCIGKNMAYMELTLALARVLFLFDFESGGELGEGKFGGEDIWDIQDQFIALKEGPMIKFTERTY
ncbi:hypothetical protein HYALB_00013870, partial [Hymenoscyphus albidus]